MLSYYLVHLYNIALSFHYILLNYALALQHQDFWRYRLKCSLFHICSQQEDQNF